MRSWNCSKVTLWKTTLEPCSIYWTRIWCVTNDDRKSNGCHCKTNSRISIHSGSGGCAQIVQNSKIRMSRYLYLRLPKHRWPSWSSMDDSVVLLEWNLYKHHSLDYWKHSSRKITGKTGNLDGKSYRVGNVYLLTENNDHVHWYTQMTWKLLEKPDVASMWKKNWKMLILTNQLHFMIFFLDALNANLAAVRTQRECAPKAYREINVRITNFCWSNWKIDFHAWKDVLKNA